MSTADRSERRLLLQIPIDVTFRPVVQMAMMRVGYLHPELEIVGEEDILSLFGPETSDPLEMKRTVMHALYREKISRDYAPLRQDLLKLLHGS